MTWVFENAIECFEAFRAEWDSINQSRRDHILLDSVFVRQLVRHFGNAGLLLAINRKRPGAALLVRGGVGSWRTFQPSQSPLGVVVLGYQDESFEGAFELLRDLPGYAMLLGITQQDPDYSAFRGTALRQDIEIIKYIETARLSVSGTFESYWGDRGTNLRHNLDRQRRRLTEQSRSLKLITHRDPAQMAECVMAYGRLESQGWKSSEGTAVDGTNVQGRFYRALLEDFCERGEGIVYQLMLDGKVVASDLCLMRKGMLVVLKTAYDESIKGISPALLMRREIVRQIYSDGEIRMIEFYGRVRDWHTKWTDQSRTMFHVNLFRSRNVAQVRELVKRFRT